MRYLAAQCHVTPRAIYNHFPCKDALMRAVRVHLLECFDGHCCEVLQRAAPTQRAMLTALTDAYIHMCAQYPHYVSCMHQHIYTNAFLHATQQDGALRVAGMDADGAQAPDAPVWLQRLSSAQEVDPMLLLAFLQGLAYIVQNAALPPRISQQAFTARIVDLLIKQLQKTPPRREGASCAQAQEHQNSFD